MILEKQIERINRKYKLTFFHIKLFPNKLILNILRIYVHLNLKFGYHI